MKNNKFKVLMYGDKFVNSSMLHKGIFEIHTPELFAPMVTITKLIQTWEGKAEKSFFKKNALTVVTNLKQCKLISISLRTKVNF